MAPPASKRQKTVANVPGSPQPAARNDFRRFVKSEPSEPEDVSQDAGQNAVTDNREGASPSSGTILEEVGDEFQNMLEGIKGDIKKIFHVRKMRFLVNTSASIKTFNQKVEKVGKNQQEQRKKLFRQYSQDFQTFFQEWAMDVRKTKEEEEKLAVLLHEHRKLLYQTKVAHKQRLKTFVHLYNNFLKSMENLEEEHERFITNKDSQLRHEMAEMGNNIQMEAKQYDLAIIETVLRTLLL